MLLWAWGSHGIHVFDEISQRVSCAAFGSGRVDVKVEIEDRLQLPSCGWLLQPVQLSQPRGYLSMLIPIVPATLYLPRILNSAAAVVPISRLCRSLILKRQKRLPVLSRCHVNNNVMDEPCAIVLTSKSHFINIWSQYSDFAISTSLQPLGSVMRAKYHG